MFVSKKINFKQALNKSEYDFEERVEKGWLIAERVFGEKPPEGQENGLLSDMVMATAYADIWSRPGLGLRDSSLITCIVLAVQEYEKELRFISEVLQIKVLADWKPKK